MRSERGLGTRGKRKRRGEADENGEVEGEGHRGRDAVEGKGNSRHL